MRLYRYGDGWESDSSQREFVASAIPQLRDAHSYVRHFFPEVGKGMLRSSTFAANVYWLDVEAMIVLFSESGHPRAREIKDALEKVERVREIIAPALPEAAKAQNIAA